MKDGLRSWRLIQRHARAVQLVSDTAADERGTGERKGGGQASGTREDGGSSA